MTTICENRKAETGSDQHRAYTRAEGLLRGQGEGREAEEGKEDEEEDRRGPLPETGATNDRSKGGGGYGASLLDTAADFTL